MDSGGGDMGGDTGDYSGDYGDPAGDTSGGDFSGGDTSTADGTSDGTDWQGPVTDENGNTTYTDELGTNYYEDAEGNTMVINPDGSGIGYMADGTEYAWDAEGNQVTTNDEGNQGPQQNGDKGSPAPPSNQQAKNKATALAQSALDAAWKAKTENPKPSATAKPPTTAALLPGGIQTAIAKKNAASSSFSLGGLSIGTILILGATGAYLLSKKKG
jgi:hypothetical protein